MLLALIYVADVYVLQDTDVLVISHFDCGE